MLLFLINNEKYLTSNSILYLSCTTFTCPNFIGKVPPPSPPFSPLKKTHTNKQTNKQKTKAKIKKHFFNRYDFRTRYQDSQPAGCDSGAVT